jgi:hypothetical protein
VPPHAGKIDKMSRKARQGAKREAVRVGAARTQVTGNAFIE